MQELVKMQEFHDVAGFKKTNKMQKNKKELFWQHRREVVNDKTIMGLSGRTLHLRDCLYRQCIQIAFYFFFLLLFPGAS